ncbi:MAG: phosphate/phosphite/phosphonate ABC transporter substrate-binding protein, partial [Opitutales bacterium]
MSSTKSILLGLTGFLAFWAPFWGLAQDKESNKTSPTEKQDSVEPAIPQASTSSAASPAPKSLSMKRLMIALKANKNPEAMLEERETLQRYLSEKMGCEVKVIIPTSSAAIVEGFANGTIDVGYLSSTDAAKNLDVAAASILLIHLRNGRTFYDSVWLCLTDKEYDSVEDLKGKPVAFAKRSSTSGFLIPLRDLHERGLISEKVGLKDFFSETIYGTGYMSVVEKVLSGEVEAAAVSDYVYLGDKYLNEDQKGQLKILQTQGPVPSHTICYRLSLSNGDRDFIKNTLTGMNKDNPELRDKVFNGPLIEVNPEEHLKVTREALAIMEKID